MAGPRRHRFHRGQNPADTTLLTRRHLLFGGAAAAVTVGVWARSSSSTADGDAGPSTTVDTTPSTSASPPTTTAPTSSSTTSTTAPTTTVPTLDSDLTQGMVGADVEAMQARLADLPFDPGPIDGIFGGQTVRSVWAFEKLVMGTPRTEMRGVLTPEIWDTMNAELRFVPRRTPGGTHMEIYLPEQVAVLFDGGVASVISHVSSGEGITWCDEVLVDNDDGTEELKGICGKAITPGGVYHFERKVEGWRKAKLGRLYKPTYFNFGIAIHGAGNVPDYPASRGCVRFPMHIAEYLQDLVSIGDAVYVFDGVEEPEVYGAQPMIFDWPDPDWVPPSTTPSTTTSTTTTSTTTTVPPATTSVVDETAASTSSTSSSSSSTTTSTTSTTVPDPANENGDRGGVEGDGTG